MTTHRSTAAALAAAGFSVLCASAHADVQLVSRDLAFSLTGAATDFSDIAVSNRSTYQVAAGSSGSLDFHSIPFPSTQSLNFFATGDVSLDNVVVDLPNSYASVIHATGPLGGTVGTTATFAVIDGAEGDGPVFRYAHAADATYAPEPFTHADLPALEVYIGGITALVVPGSPWTVSVTMAGNYANTAGAASTSGQHVLAYLDSHWTITRDFEYDAALNRTTFAALNPTFRAGQEPDLDFYLIGGAVAAVPEPGTLLLMGIGVAVGSVGLRRRVAAAG